MNSLKKVLYSVVLTLLLPGNSVAQNLVPGQSNTAVWEYTYLKSRPGEHERLVRFITQNWFVMDSLATRRGLMNGYKLLDAGETAPGDWNLLVAVAYPQKDGYDGIKEAFETIRHDHVKRLIDGLDLPQLGTIVISQKIHERISRP